MRQRLNLLLCSAVLALGRMSSPPLANAANSWHVPESPAVVTEDLRFTNGDAMRRVLHRWRKEAEGKWAIVSVEDTTGKRSSWSDIPDLAAAIAQVRAENGNA